MFKCTIVIAVLAVSASLGGCTPTAPGGAGGSQQQEPSVASTNFHGHKTMHKPQNIVYVPTVHEGHDLLGSSVYGVLKTLSISKKMVGTAVGCFIGMLKKVNVKKILNTALVGATIAVLGALAVVAVSGIVSLVSGICAMVPYVNLFYGHGDVPEPHIDTVSDFALGAFDKYDNYHKA